MAAQAADESGYGFDEEMLQPMTNKVRDDALPFCRALTEPCVPCMHIILSSDQRGACTRPRGATDLISVDRPLFCSTRGKHGEMDMMTKNERESGLSERVSK